MEVWNGLEARARFDSTYEGLKRSGSDCASGAAAGFDSTYEGLKPKPHRDEQNDNAFRQYL